MASLSKTIERDGVAEDVKFTDEQGNEYTDMYGVVDSFSRYDKRKKIGEFTFDQYQSKEKLDAGAPPLKQVYFSCQGDDFDTYISPAAIRADADLNDRIYTWLAIQPATENHDPADWVDSRPFE